GVHLVRGLPARLQQPSVRLPYRAGSRAAGAESDQGTPPSFRPALPAHGPRDLRDDRLPLPAHGQPAPCPLPQRRTRAGGEVIAPEGIVVSPREMTTILESPRGYNESGERPRGRGEAEDSGRPARNAVPLPPVAGDPRPAPAVLAGLCRFRRLARARPVRSVTGA